MSRLDAFFNKGFKGAKCRTLLKLTIPRIKLLRNRKEIRLKQMRKEIAKLLETLQEATAWIQVENMIQEKKIIGAHEIIQLFCELIQVRLPVIETQRECPLDLKEAISTLCFVAPRCSDLPELLQVQMLFAAKYGKEFVTCAMELMRDCGVNRQIIELLSIRAPPVEEKLKLLKEIAEEHRLDWNPTTTEARFLKLHEDLLNGPNQLLKDKNDDTFRSVPGNLHKKWQPESDIEILPLHGVPKDHLQLHSEAPDVATPSPSSQNSAISTVQHPIEDAASRSSTGKIWMMPLNPDVSFGTTHTPDVELCGKEEAPLHPDVAKLESPSSLKPSSLDIRKESTNSHDKKDSGPTYFEKVDHLNPNQKTLSNLRTKRNAAMDFQDVLAATLWAVETADHAVAAARSTVKLVEIRISELCNKKDNDLSGNNNDNQDKELPDTQTSSTEHVNGVQCSRDDQKH